MPYLIDGHNLIPQITGLSLNQLDDEEALISLLQRFCSVRRSSAEVYFDRAAPGASPKKRFGAVSASFIRSPRTADDAIRTRLKKLGRAAKNWIVISSDRQVQAEARAAGAQVSEAVDFAHTLDLAISQQGNSSNSRPNHGS